MMNLQWDDLDESVVNDACCIADLDRALARVFNVLDPRNREDLGGEAAHFFEGPNDIRRWWHDRAGIAERRRQLDAFLNYLFAVSIEEWHDEHVMRQAVGA